MPRIESNISLRVFCMALLISRALCADSRSLAFLIGPASEEHGRIAAHAAALVARQWFQTPGAIVELRFTANPDTQPFTAAMQIKDLESTFLYAADTDRKSDWKGLVNGFDRAGFSLTHHEGKRLMIAILDVPALNSDASDRLTQTLAFCKENSITVVVLDLSEPASNAPQPAIASLASSTGGALLRDSTALDSTVETIFPTEKPVVTSEKARPADTAIHVRFLRIQSSKMRSAGSEFGPLHGFFVAESPLTALQLQEQGGNYSGRARVTEMLRAADGKVVWQAKKDIVIKGPSRKLDSRRAGLLSYMRELQIPGGNYILDATVEDLVAGKTLTVSEPLIASSRAPGFDVSDIVLVRPLDDAVDKFESDTTFVFDTRALVPLLDPPYRANQPLDLQIYMVIYPDLRGGQPDLNLEILQGAQAVAKSHLLFNDKVRNSASEGSGLDAKGDQKDEFPYLAHLPNVSLSAGNYEARVTIRQDKRTLTRSVAFQVR